MHRRSAFIRPIFLSVILSFLTITLVVHGQTASTASTEQVRAIQEKLDALQSQMAEVRGELQRLSSGTIQAPAQTAPEVTDPKSALAGESKEEKKVEAELTPKQKEIGQGLGKSDRGG